MSKMTYRSVSIIRIKGDQSQNVFEHNGKPNLVSETYCLALTHQPKNAKIKKKAEMKTKKYIKTPLFAFSSNELNVTS